MEKKRNEITAIPEVMEAIEIKVQVVTIDAMGTQKETAETIRKRKADHVLALKGNQGTLHEEVRLFVMAEEEKEKIRKKGAYYQSVEKAHGQVEIREYYQTEEIGGKKMSLQRKCFNIAMNPMKYLEEILSFKKKKINLNRE